MFGKVAAFELRYQTRQPVFWVVALVFFLLTFGATTIEQISVGGLGPNDHKNGPFSLAVIHLSFTLFYMFVTTAFVANVIVRDDETGYGPLVRTTRISKFDYLYGRFAGAFAAAALSFVAVPLAVLAGSAMPWVDPERFGAFMPGAYLYSYFVLALPGLFFSAALFFAVATVTRSMAWTYIGVVVLMVFWIIGGILLSRPEYEQFAAFDPLGLSIFGLVTKYWTATERNAVLPAIEGALLWNRVGAVAVSAGFLALAYALFRFEAGAARGKRAKTQKLAAAAAADAPPPAPLGELPAPRFDTASAFAQLLARTRLDFAQVFKSPAYFVLLAVGLFNAAGGLWFATEADRYGGAIYPVTRVLIPVLVGAFSLIPLIIAGYYGGELVWRERERKTHEIIDATPVPDWAFVLPKTAAIALVLISTLLVSVLAAIAIQTMKGYLAFELDKYLLWYVLPQAVDMTLVAILAVFFQAISPHKFIGWGLMVLYLISTFTLRNIGLEHNLYTYGGVPDVPLSDMNGQGRFWQGAWWLRLYWSAFAAFLLVLTYALWRRGTESRLWPRLKRLPFRLASRAGLVALAALAVFAASGVFIYINTNVWNEYRTQRGDEAWTADFEKALLKYEQVPQPKIVEVKLDVDIYPRRARIDTRGVYVIENKTDQPLREIHTLFDRDLKVEGLSIEGARPKQTFDRFNYRIFTFDTPMLPGERRTMSFITRLEQRGFRNSNNLTRVVGNGTFIDNTAVSPYLGVSRFLLLTDRAVRRRHGLPAELRMPKLGDQASRAFNYFRHDADFVKADITVSTAADQTPIAPGYRVTDEVKDGRRTVRYVTEAPILPGFSLQSARYAVKTGHHKGVDLAIYHDPRHPWNIERMMTSMKLSLDYFQAEFSPYQFRQLRYIEFPDYAQFAQAFAGTIPWSEGLGFIASYEDPSKIDLVTYVGAHEVAHQWWAHQVVGADQQGSTMLSETLAQYSALRVMRRLYGPDMIRKFLKFELDNYLRSRGGQSLEEQPLARVENQAYIHYRKGSLVMYRLAEEIGEDAVNRALRNFLEQYAFKGAPYPNSMDLIALIRAEAPADKQQLITDLFERITLYDVKTTGMAVKERADGRFDVSLTIEARKLYADGLGKETEAPMNEVLDVGLFTAMPGDKAFKPADVVAFERRPIRSGRQTLTFVTDRAPKFGGADPYNKLIDRNSDDNVGKPN
ncbi:MAG TPA: M1 family aminopeptidase [Caulobacteraceae bacterium]|nr:M1 family aminopeptidase [Caulobacteraceae bacterium]